MNFARPFKSVIEYKGKKIRLNLAFDRVLILLEAWKDQTISDVEKVDLCCDLLIKSKTRLSILEKSEIVARIFDEFLFTQKSDDKSKPNFDFEQDADYIYSAFMQTYHIDLIHERGRLDWRRFISLFQGLPEDTKIREIMDIRSKKLPAPTKYNQEERRSLIEAKRAFALDKGTPENFQQGLADLYSVLKSRVKGG